MHTPDTGAMFYLTATTMAYPAAGSYTGCLTTIGASTQRDVTACQTFGHVESGEIRARKMVASSARRVPETGQFDWSNARRWTIEGAAIDALRDFLNSEDVVAGTYRLVDSKGPATRIAGLIADGKADATALAELLNQKGALRDFLSSFDGQGLPPV